MHEKVLNYMLAHTCHNTKMEGVRLREFTFDLHCLEVTVFAECLTPAPWTDDTIPEYKIISFDVKDI